ncbi:hypothetical protein [Sellimonas sp.]|uniref:hypothetical protein n=1 Tax=Sellimonas sp. TaxID=2021466 RepID=UPI0025810CC8|nr:hypothetical protein [Sellimonas sp.]
MKPEEAINVLLENVPKCCKMIDGRYQGGFNDWDCDMGQAIRLAVLALQDIRNYRNIVNKTDRNELAKIIDEWLEYSKIGTVKECREAVEKQRPKKVKIKAWSPVRCPSCDYELSTNVGDGYYKHPIFLERCPQCGQKLDWSEEE